MSQKQSAFIIDPLVCGDQVNPEEQAVEKRLSYSKPEVERYVRDFANDTMLNIEVHGIAISMRGAWAVTSSNFYHRLGLPHKLANLITLCVLNATWHLILTYNRCFGGRPGDRLI